VAFGEDGSSYAMASCLGLPTGGQSASPAWIVTPTRILTLATTACGRAVGLSSTGSLLAVQTEDGEVDVWDMGSYGGQGWLTPPTPLVVTLRHRPATTGWVAFSPDDSMLLTAGVDGTARVWNLPSGEPRFVLDTGGGPVEVALWTPDGAHIVTSSHDGVPRIWDARTGRLEAELPAHGTWPHLAMTPDGRRLFTSADRAVTSWIIDSTELVATAQARLTRGLTEAECDRYGINPCPTTDSRS
jgi:WD40 repeat protein